MKLAFIIDDYLPHSTRIGAKMFHELACEFVGRGHSVTVITPDNSQSKMLVKETLDDVSIWYFKSGETKDVGKVKRAINETLLSFHAWRAISKEVDQGSFDAVIYYSPSIFFGPLVKKIKKRCGCSAYLVLRDLFPQWAIDAGMIRSGSMIEKYFRYFEHVSYKQADMIGLMSERNVEVFQAENFQYQYQSQVLRNWASLLPSASKKLKSYREELNLQDKVIYFYGGNIGHAQDMSNLMRLAKNMQSYENAHFLFVGQGNEVELINQLSQEWQLSNFSYLPSVNQEEFKQILSEVDVGLFSLASHHTAHNFPGKLLGYMVESLPILGSVNGGNDLMPLVNEANAGFIHVNGEDDVLLTSAATLCSDGQLRLEMGKSAYMLLSDEFSVQAAATTILSEID
ncbi:glycosyltransferase family 4 protein [Vibrio sp. S17_S38]|uniref:glycosyltransferase family 4 protein n=1 Tax=Vibrio sp. S17_S38 TaxID=2720229 RepID=UPI001681879E|nr:glycosyltransferase family 4 protein [Vibrio sp. S17_S38]MBD1573261.1 glycosyltransferase family 4 protein [Vibrio sp. S17_S38]